MMILQVAAGLDSRDGGPAYSVPRLAAALERVGITQSIHTVGSDSACEDAAYQASSQDFARIPLVRGLRLSSDWPQTNA